MKKLFFAITIVIALALLTTSVNAQKLTATSTPVVMKAIVPEYIGLTAVNTAPVVFNFKHLDDAAKEQFVRGGELSNFTASNAPSWELTYNLSHRTVTVCAYATDLINGGEEASKIPAGFILGVPLQYTGGNGRWFGQNGGCSAGMGTGSILMDHIQGATSTFYTEPTHVRTEGFSIMQIVPNPGSNGLGSYGVPAPGTYLGTMYVVAQAI